MTAVVVGEAERLAYERLLSRTRREGKRLNGQRCLVFTGGLSGNGYAQINVAGRVRNGHRFAFEVRHGPLPPGIEVCHHCDNPPCLEDAHHFAGTRRENIDDMIAKGRSPRTPSGVGEGHYRAQLSEADVREIRTRRAAGEPLRAIAEDHGVSKAMVWQIAARRKWAHVA